MLASQTKRFLIALFIAMLAIAMADMPNLEQDAHSQLLEILDENRLADMEDMNLFARAPFDPQNDARDKEIYEYMLASHPDFEERRAARVQMEYHMSLQEYDALHAKHRLSLLSLADSLKVPYSVAEDNFNSLLTRVNDELAQRAAKPEAAAFIDRAMLSTSAELKMAAYLFEGRVTLQTARTEDMLRGIIPDKVKEWAKKAVAYLASKKCDFCKKVASSIASGACTVVGKGICFALAQSVNAVLPGAGPALDKFVCGWPVNFSSVIAKGCMHIVNKFVSKIKMPWECYCAWSLPKITFPKLLGGGSIGGGGQICTPAPGSCIYHSKDDKKKFDNAPKPEKDCKGMIDCAKKAAQKKIDSVKKATNKVKEIAKDVKKDGVKGAWNKHKEDAKKLGKKVAVKAGEIVLDRAISKVTNKAYEKTIGKGVKNVQDKVTAKLKSSNNKLVKGALNVRNKVIGKSVKEGDKAQKKIDRHEKTKKKASEKAKSQKKAIKEKAKAKKASSAKAASNKKASSAKAASAKKAKKDASKKKASSRKASSSTKKTNSSKKTNSKKTSSKKPTKKPTKAPPKKPAKKPTKKPTKKKTTKKKTTPKFDPKGKTRMAAAKGKLLKDGTNPIKNIDPLSGFVKGEVNGGAKNLTKAGIKKVQSIKKKVTAKKVVKKVVKKVTKKPTVKKVVKKVTKKPTVKKVVKKVTKKPVKKVVKKVTKKPVKKVVKKVTKKPVKKVTKKKTTKKKTTSK